MRPTYDKKAQDNEPNGKVGHIRVTWLKSVEAVEKGIGSEKKV